MLNVHSINDVSKLKYTQLSCWHEPNGFEVLTVIENSKRYKSSGIGQALAELIHSGSGIVCSEIHKLTNCVWNKEEIPQQWKEPLYP